MAEDIDITNLRPGPLPLEPEDIPGGEKDEESREPALLVDGRSRLSYGKLFATLVMVAPIATLLSLGAADLYKTAMENAGSAAVAPVVMTSMQGDTAANDRELMATVDKKIADLEKKVTVAIAKADAAVSQGGGAPAAVPDTSKLDAAIGSLSAAQKQLAEAIDKNSAAVEKLGAAKPSVVKVEDSNPRIVVVKVPSGDTFDLHYELEKILVLSGVDLDDPVTGPEPFDAMTSRDALKEVLRALDAIIGASRDHAEVNEFLLQNALRAKKYVQQRQREVK